MKRIIFFMAVFIAAQAKGQFFAGIEVKTGGSDVVKNYEMMRGTPKLSYFIGADVGYEVLNRFPVSIGIEYGKLCRDYDFWAPRGAKSSFRIPLMIGYCYYIRNFRPFFNIGAFMSVGDKWEINYNNELLEDPAIVRSTEMQFKTGFGYLGKIGISYKFFDRLLISGAFEYNRPFSNEEKFKFKGWDGDHSDVALCFYGVSIGANIYF